MGMRLLFINPNTTASITEAIEAQARSVAAPGTEIVAVNPSRGPAALETRRDEEVAIEEMLSSLSTWRPDCYDGVAIACFGDPGLDRIRALVRAPVVGIAQAAMLSACALGMKFGVVAALESAIPIMSGLATDYGFGERLTGVRPVGISVMEMARDIDRSREAIELAVRRSFADGAESVCLGCAAMGQLAPVLTAELDRPVIDGVQSATKLLEEIVVGEHGTIPATVDGAMS
ncbi:aspartate/glutamate racemase family protein [Micromonospora sp. NPDC048830]|uniref:aspartate/glutamate racemase family protein n=1 Tax=Micromonospora sp. NPDC048830 TaxID=3364257 RepID=UPI00371A2106